MNSQIPVNSIERKYLKEGNFDSGSVKPLQNANFPFPFSAKKKKRTYEFTSAYPQGRVNVTCLDENQSGHFKKYSMDPLNFDSQSGPVEGQPGWPRGQIKWPRATVQSWGVLVSVNFGCFSPSRFSHFHCNTMRKAIKARKNLHTN